MEFQFEMEYFNLREMHIPLEAFSKTHRLKYVSASFFLPPSSERKEVTKYG